MAKETNVKAKRPGLYESKGSVSSDFPAYDKGDYFVEVDSFEPTTTASKLEMHKAKLVILDGPKQKDGRDIEGLPIFANMVILDEDHEFYQMGIDRLKNFLNAAGVKVDKNGEFKHQSAVGKKFWVALSKKQAKDEQGVKIDDKFRNDINSCFIDDDNDRDDV